MKRFVYILICLFLTSYNIADAFNASKEDLKAVKNVLKTQIESANKYDYDKFISHFDTQYINSDGFPLEIYSQLVKETWQAYSNIQYAQQIKNITITGNDAIAEVVETANANVNSQYELKGNLKSIANNIYFLKKTEQGWKILSDVILTEDTYLSFGEMVNHLPVLTVPYQTLANRNYTAKLEYIVPKDTIAIASLNQEKVTYPQESAKENYRKLPDDGILERFFTANNENTNEYIVASVGLTRPVFDNKDLQISVTGVAYIIKRVNVVPENKFINKDAILSVNATLKEEQDKDEDIVEEITPTIIKKEPENTDIKDEKNIIRKIFGIKKDNKVEAEKVKEPKVEKVKQPKVEKAKEPKVEKVKQPKVEKAKEPKVEKVKQPKPEKAKEPKVEKVKQPKPEKAKEPKVEKVKQPKAEKVKKERSTKGTFSPTPIDIPTTIIKKEVE